MIDILSLFLFVKAWFLMDSLFNIIKIKPTSLAKKKKIFGLYFIEDTAFKKPS